MRNIIAMAGVTSALHIDQAQSSGKGPDVFGPNGVNYTNVSLDQDMARIQIDILEKGDGKGDKKEKCLPGKWSKISYKGYLKNGQQVMDSDAVGGDLIFSVGASQTFKCFDLALTQVVPGAKVHLECPYDLVYGGATIQAPLGGEWIPKYSDMDFDIEVKWCNHNPGQYMDNMYWGDDL